MSENNFRYEDKIHELNEVLEKYRPRWRLRAIAWMDYDDVCQIIRLHVHNKWHLWDQEKNFKPWVSTLINNQIINLVRNHYGRFAKPCMKCQFNQGGDGCGMTKSGVQDFECDIFARWKSKKERAYNLKLALPIEEGAEFGETTGEESIDFDKSSKRLHSLVMKELPEKQAQIYRSIYMEHKSDEEVAAEHGFKKDPSKREQVRYKHLNNLKKKFYEIAQRLMQEEDII